MSAAKKSPSAEADTSVDSALPPSSPRPSSPRPSSPRPSNENTSKNKNKKAPILAVLATGPSRIDAFLAHLAKCMQTRTGAETVLLFVCYATRLAGSILEGVGGAAIRQSARRLVALAYKLPPATTVVMASTKPQPSLAAVALQIGGRLKALSGVISETRTVARLWGLLGLYFAAKRLVLKSAAAKAEQQKQQKQEDGQDGRDGQDAAETTFDTLVAYAQITSLIVFQAAENAAFLSSKKVLPLAPATQGRLGLLSVRAWGLYVAMEGARLLVERSRKQGSGLAAKDAAEWTENWNKSFCRNLSWAPLTLHWGSATGGFLPDIAISLLGFYPAAGAMADLWKGTAA